jgi:hypothetical protein
MMRFFFALDLRPETESRISDQRFVVGPGGGGAEVVDEPAAAAMFGKEMLSRSWAATLFQSQKSLRWLFYFAPEPDIEDRRRIGRREGLRVQDAFVEDSEKDLREQGEKDEKRKEGEGARRMKDEDDGDVRASRLGRR